jgi:hypothetical protein
VIYLLLVYKSMDIKVLKTHMCLVYAGIRVAIKCCLSSKSCDVLPRVIYLLLVYKSMDITVLKTHMYLMYAGIRVAIKCCL